MGKMSIYKKVYMIKNNKETVFSLKLNNVHIPYINI